MTHEEFTGVTFIDFDLSGTRISRSSELFVVNSTEIVLNIPHKAEFYESRDNSLCYKYRKWIITCKDMHPLDVTHVLYFKKYSGLKVQVCGSSVVNK